MRDFSIPFGPSSPTFEVSASWHNPAARLKLRQRSGSVAAFCRAAYGIGRQFDQEIQ